VHQGAKASARAQWCRGQCNHFDQMVVLLGELSTSFLKVEDFDPLNSDRKLL
jgi:hypothetical protein